jgi:Protein of unknown function (DUF5672)/Galactosyltransferase
MKSYDLRGGNAKKGARRQRKNSLLLGHSHGNVGQRAGICLLKAVVIFIAAFFVVNVQLFLMLPDDNGMHLNYPRGWSNGLFSYKTHTFTTCIVVGMFSRSTEFRLRQWQRDKFQKEFANFPKLDSKVKVQQRFSIAYNVENSSVMEDVYREQEEHGDIFLVHVQEKYQWLVGHVFEMLRQAVDLLNDGTCDAKFIVKTDSDVFVSLQNLVPVVQAMPISSTYFGLMSPNTPTHDLWTRIRGSFSYSFLPVWAVGQMYGMSADVAERLVQPEVEQTVLKRDIGYMFTEEDRSIGLALARSQTKVQNLLFLKGLYFFCEVQHISCLGYGKPIAIGVGIGLSGEGEQKMNNKLAMLEKVQSTIESCMYDPSYQVQDQFFLIDDAFLNSSAYEWLFEGCTQLPEESRLTLEAYHQRASVGYFDLHGRDKLEYECAESMYRSANPAVNQQVQDGLYIDARDHYLQWGHRTGEMSYFCPQKCFNSSDMKSCTMCDKEALYLKNYPDVKAVVDAGILESGLSHYENSGRAEGRSYSCYERFQEEGKGNSTGCLETFSRFIDDTSEIVLQWPVMGRKQVQTNPATCKAVLLIEGRDHKWMDYALRVHRRYTGPDWIFYLLGPPHVAAAWRKKYSGPMVTIVDLPKRYGNLSHYPEEINNVYRSKFLWNDVVQCEYVLVSQTDALLLRHGIEDFFEYSYVGSPVYPESFPTIDWRYLCAKTKNCGGNGGLSLRRRSECQRALETCSIPQHMYDEDVWYSACLAESGAKLPHPVIANRFSTGSKCQADSPFGVHKLWQNCKESTCAAILLMSQLYKDTYVDISSNRYCKEGEMTYLTENEDVKKLGLSAWEHYKSNGIHENRAWKCFDRLLDSRSQPKPFDLPKKLHSRSQGSKGWFVW